ncbi:MAG: NosD domain-containing protein [Thermoplasmatota archaeon]
MNSTKKKLIIVSILVLFSLTFIHANPIEKNKQNLDSNILNDDSLEPGLIWNSINKVGGGEIQINEHLAAESPDLIRHGPIYINGNDNFFSKAERENWKGNGTEDNPIIIENYDIAARSAGNGIMVSNTNLHFIIRNCMVYNAAFISNPYLAGEGIATYNSSNGLIASNTVFSNGGDGIDLKKSKNISVYMNEASSNKDDGIHVSDSINCRVKNNTVSTNDDDGIYVDGESKKIIIRNNMVNLNTEYSIFLFHTDESLVKDNEIIKGRAGIVISDCNEITMNRNIVQDSKFGLYLSNMVKSKINNNEVSGGDYGIYASLASNNLFTDNKLVSNKLNGITLRLKSENNVLDNNTVSKNDKYGIHLSDSDKNKIYNTTISSNRWVGLLIFNSKDNIIRYNNITKNNIGTDIKESAGNLIFNNNFIKNTKQVSAQKDNKWNLDYPKGGNYWSDYTGEDIRRGPDQDQEGRDGIGDSPYKIYLDVNFDKYPLMTPIKSSSKITHPSTPRNFKVSSGDGYTSLEWEIPESNGGSPIIHYKIYRGKDLENITFYKSTKDLENSIIDSNVENNVTYHYYIKAVNSIYESNKTQTLSVRPEREFTPPSVPQNLTSEVDNENNVVLRWEPPSDNISVTNYNIYGGKNSKEKIKIGNVSGGILKYYDEISKRNITYYYQISGENSAGESNRSDETVAEIEPEFYPPLQPTGLSISESQNNITIKWKQPEETGGKKIIGYRIYRSKSNEQKIHIATVMNKKRFVDKNVTKYQTYHYSVSAYNVVGESELSEEATGESSFQGKVGDNRGFFYKLDWFLIPLLTIIAMLIIAKLFVIKPVIKA